MGIRAKCEGCGEWMANAYPVEKGRLKGKYFCGDCSGEKVEFRGHKRDRGADTDLRYHGGRFHTAEW